VDMGRAVIIHIDFHAQAIEAKDSRHWCNYNLIAWVFQVVAVGVKVATLAWQKSKLEHLRAQLRG
jgi:hypothetical protein